MVDKIRDRKLPERSYLTFQFPSPGRVPILVRLPFFENVDIQESKTATYHTYDLPGRHSNLYTYISSKSRELRLSFQLTLPHLRETVSQPALRSLIESTVDSKARAKEAFTRGELESPAIHVKTGQETIAVENFAGSHEELQDLAELFGDDPEFFNQLSEDGANAVSLVENRILGGGKHVDLLLWWINIIRSSVMNNSQIPAFGPPIVTLTHGIMYNDIPCICKGYNFSMDKMAGMDLLTLLSRRINVTMDLEELRTGDFSEYRLGDKVKGNNIAGWEAVIEEGSTDPYTITGWL